MLFDTKNPVVEIVCIFLAVVLADMATEYLKAHWSGYPAGAHRSY